MANIIKCPHCNKSFEMTEALRHEIETATRHEIETEVEKIVSEKLTREFEESSSLELADLQKQLAEKDKKVSELRDNELKLREDRRKLEDREKELKLEVERQLDDQRKKIEEEVLGRAVEEHRLKDKEKDKVIDDLKNALDDARRRAQQGSQQLQGEVLELDIEEMLRSAFPADEIQPVGKGVRGADVRQIVKSPKGFTCGVVLWETKRTKAWTDSWITKLKSDLRAEKANIPVIISMALPSEAKSGFGLKDGVWVVDFALVLPLATVLRKNLLDIGFEKAVSAHKGEKADVLYDYITSHEFRQQVEALAEVYKEMSDQIARERAAYERLWKSREGQVQRLITSTAGVVGSIQGKIGQSALQIKGLDLLELDSGD